MTLPFLAGQKPTAEALTVAVRRIRALGRRASASSTTTTTTIGVLRLDDIPVEAGRSYAITAKYGVLSTVANDWVVVTMRYSTDGSTPTTASAILPGGQATHTADLANLFEHGMNRTVYEPTSDEVLSVLLCVVRQSGTGNVSLWADAASDTQLTIEDIGEAVGDTGTDI